MKLEGVDWIEGVLPLLRCPDTHQPLRWAQPADLSHHGLPETAKALVNQDGTRLFAIEDGIPILLPQAITRSTP